MKKWLIFGIFIMFISQVSAFMCSQYAGQEISMDIFWNECAWYLSIPGIVLGLIFIIWPSILFRINYFVSRHLWGKGWKEEWGDQEKVVRHFTEYPSGRIGIRLSGIVFLIFGLIVLILQIIH